MRHYDITKIQQISILEDGIKLSVESGTISHPIYICTDGDFCPEKDNGFTLVEFNPHVYLIFPGQTTNHSAVFDLAVKFMLANDIYFEHIDEFDAGEMDLMDEYGGVKDHIEYYGTYGHLYVAITDFVIRTTSENVSLSDILSSSEWTPDDVWVFFHAKESDPLQNIEMHICSEGRRARQQMRISAEKTLGMTLREAGLKGLLTDNYSDMISTGENSEQEVWVIDKLPIE